MSVIRNMGNLLFPTRNTVVCHPQGWRKEEQAEELRESESRVVTTRIGSYDLTENGADFESGRNRESVVKETRMT